MKIELKTTICIWCGKHTEYDPDDDEAMMKAWAEMKEHDRNCPEHPLQKTIDRYRTALEEAEEVLEVHYNFIPEKYRSELLRIIRTAK